MKRAEIEVGKTYAAKVRWEKNVIVRVLALDIEQKHGYGTATRKTGVRVENVESYRDWNKEIPAGSTHVISTRDIYREWTEEDQRKREDRQRSEAELARRGDAVRRALSERGIEVRPGRGQVTLTFDQVDELLEARP